MAITTYSTGGTSTWAWGRADTGARGTYTITVDQVARRQIQAKASLNIKQRDKRKVL